MSKYANLNDYPLVLHGPTGGSRYFRPGEAQDGGWWSRFIAGGQLTEVADDYLPSRDFRRKPRPMHPVVSPTVVPERLAGAACRAGCEAQCQAVCEASCEVACESGEQIIKVHDHYEQVGNGFYCRHCDWSTLREASVQQHLESYHEDQLGGSDTAEDPEKSLDQQRSLDPGVEAVESTVPAQDSPSIGPADESEYWSIEKGVLICQKCMEQGVEWKTASQSAMTRHARRYHDAPREQA